MTVSAVIFWDRVRKEDPFFVCYLANAGEYYYKYTLFEKNLYQKSFYEGMEVLNIRVFLR